MHSYFRHSGYSFSTLLLSISENFLTILMTPFLFNRYYSFPILKNLEKKIKKWHLYKSDLESEKALEYLEIKKKDVVE